MKEEEKEVKESKEKTDSETLKSDYFEQLGITLSSITQDIKNEAKYSRKCIRVTCN